jgi:hypothetical protein
MDSNSLLKTFYSSGYSNRRLFIVFVIIYCALIVDLGVSKFTDLVPNEITSMPVVALFILITSICIFGQYYFYVKVTRKLADSKFGIPHTTLQDLAVGIVNYILISINIIIIVQLIILSSYNLSLLIVSGTLSYGLAALLLGILSKRFFSWFLAKRSIVVLIYALATAAMSFNAIITTVYFDSIVLNKSTTYGSGLAGLLQSNITPKTSLDVRDNYTSHDILGRAGELLLDAETHSVDVYFTLTWIATALLLLYNVARIGKIKYWTLFGITLIYFFSYYVSPVNLVEPASSDESTQVVIFFLLFDTYSITIGGFLFGIGFWLLSKSIQIQNKIKDYMIIVAFSFMLFFNVAEATISQTSFPPFGLANVSFVGISAYMMLAGLSSSAISISKDIELRKYIKNLVIETSNLFGNIGTAQTEAEVKDKVKFFAKEKGDLFEEETKVGVSLSDDEITQYIDEAINEMKKTRTNIQNDK